MRSRALDLSRRCSGMILVGAALACPASVRGEGPEDDVRGKISRNYYRIPFVNGTDVTITRDYIDHGVTQNGSSANAGRIDMSAAGATIVAAADGEVILVDEDSNDCGCDDAYSDAGCHNVVAIRHANGEISEYVHIAQNSATNFGIGVGSMVLRGDPIAIEGDVGWTCGGGRAANAGTCLPSVPAGAGSCGRHLHWHVYRETTVEFVNPIICSVSGRIFQDDATYTADLCLFAEDDCSHDESVSGATFSGFGTFEVVQALDTITADDSTVQNLASLVLHAGNKVSLQPGFLVVPEAYFRAEIGPCNNTAPTPP